MPYVHRAYYGAMEFIERHIFGSRLQAWAWRTRHLFHRGWTNGYRATLNHPHRAVLADAIAAYAPESVLEVGCNVGVNLAILGENLPGCTLYGVDINRAAIAYGRRWLGGRANLRCASAAALPFPDKSVDIVFTDAVLMCIGPDQITHVLNELTRVARLGVVLNEFLCEGSSRYLDGHWAHDYRTLAPTSRARPLPPDSWGEGAWPQYGRIVEIIPG